jgi:hypothetical protein
LPKRILINSGGPQSLQPHLEEGRNAGAYSKRKRIRETGKTVVFKPATFRGFQNDTDSSATGAKSDGSNGPRSNSSSSRRNIEEPGCSLSKPSVKLHLAAQRRLFDHLVLGQILPKNPAFSVRGPPHFVKSEKTYLK